MKDYIYVDYDFIQSYLAQAGKGLSQSTLYSNSTMKQETERTGNTEYVASSGGELKGKSSHEISVKLYKSNFGGDTSFNVDLNNLIYLFEVWKSQSQITEEAISIELHDYAIELFENSFISEDSNKRRFKKSANLEFIQLSSNYKNDVSPITDLLESDFMIENDIPNYSKLTSSQKKEQKREHLRKKREEMNVDQSNLILAALTSIFPSQISVSFVEKNNFYLGTLNEENMRMNISEILFLYGNKTNLTIIGIFSRELTSVQSQYSELNMYSQLRVDFVSIINDFYKDSLNSVVIFKPILIYRSV